MIRYSVLRGWYFEKIARRYYIFDVMTQYILYLKHFKEARLLKEYFESMKPKIDSICNDFFDGESSALYRSLIESRKKYTHNYTKYISEDEQYFIPEIKDMLSRFGDITFVDCGCYDGKTSERFSQLTKGNYKQIIAFEPDPDNMKKIIDSWSDEKHMCVINAGVWDKQGTLIFDAGKGGSSRVVSDVEEKSSDHLIQINTECIDNIQLSGHIFIKMDVEGAEMPALKGAESTIHTYKPLLAICIYHSNEDMIEIPSWLIETCGREEYLFFLRHHSECYPETVIYAVPKLWK